MTRLISVLLAVVILSSALTVAGCGSGGSTTAGSPAAASGASSTTSGTHFAKTKFALHAGLAFGAFHRYIYKPYRRGAFSGGLFHHKLATVKAALAAAFAYHEVKLALADARSSRLLSKALGPLLALQTKFHTMASGFRDGTANPAAITSADAAAARTSQLGARAGQPVTDQPSPAF